MDDMAAAAKDEDVQLSDGRNAAIFKARRQDALRNDFILDAEQHDRKKSENRSYNLARRFRNATINLGAAAVSTQMLQDAPGAHAATTTLAGAASGAEIFSTPDNTDYFYGIDCWWLIFCITVLLATWKLIDLANLLLHYTTGRRFTIGTLKHCTCTLFYKCRNWCSRVTPLEDNTNIPRAQQRVSFQEPVPDATTNEAPTAQQTYGAIYGASTSAAAWHQEAQQTASSAASGAERITPSTPDPTTQYYAGTNDPVVNNYWRYHGVQCDFSVANMPKIYVPTEPVRRKTQLRAIYTSRNRVDGGRGNLVSHIRRNCPVGLVDPQVSLIDLSCCGTDSPITMQWCSKCALDANGYVLVTNRKIGVVLDCHTDPAVLLQLAQRLTEDRWAFIPGGWDSKHIIISVLQQYHDKESILIDFSGQPMTFETSSTMPMSDLTLRRCRVQDTSILDNNPNTWSNWRFTVTKDVRGRGQAKHSTSNSGGHPTAVQQRKATRQAIWLRHLEPPPKTNFPADLTLVKHGMQFEPRQVYCRGGRELYSYRSTQDDAGQDDEYAQSENPRAFSVHVPLFPEGLRRRHQDPRPTADGTLAPPHSSDDDEEHYPEPMPIHGHLLSAADASNNINNRNLDAFARSHGTVLR
jgi:hypothetical protein